MLPQRLANFAFFAVAAVTIVASDDPAADTAAPEPTAEALATAAVEDTEGFAVMPTPRPGEWLARFEEEHVTLDEYIAGKPVRADGEQCILAFVPAGPFTTRERAVMDSTVEFCGLWFDVSTRTLPGLDVPTSGEWTRTVHNSFADAESTQIHTEWFLRKALPRRRPPDAVTLVAVTMSDLYPGRGWNYVFGQALLRGRVGVYSLVRHFPAFWGEEDTLDARKQAIRRSLKLVTHEVGHTFGLEHCVRYRCNMNGSNSLDESDRAPLHLCPDCLAKLRWNRGFDALERYERLRAFFARNGLDSEADWIAARIKRIRAAAGASNDE